MVKSTPSSPDPEGKTRSRSPRPMPIAEFLSTPGSGRLSFPPSFSRQSLPSSSSKRDLSPPPLGSKRNSLPGRTSVSLLSHVLSSPQRKSVSHPKDRDGFSIPKPIMRLILCLAIFGTGMIFILRASTRDTPLLRAVTRRDLASQGGNGYTTDMLDRPPASAVTGIALARHPIPASHEFLALQSYLLQNPHHALPIDIDPKLPLDGNIVLDIPANRLGKPGSKLEKKWLKELERQHGDNIVIWSPKGANIEMSKMFKVLAELHSPKRSPALIELEGRADKSVLEDFLARLGIGMNRPILMLGNRMYQGGLQELETKLADKTLESEMKRIGWYEEKKVEVEEDDEEEVVEPGKKKKAKAKKIKAPKARNGKKRLQVAV